MKKVDVNLKVFLTEFGLSEREIVLYLALLKTGPNTIMNLARETGIKRSTTHNNVEELIKKGLVSQTNYGERRMVVAEPPNKLDILLSQKRWAVSKMEEKLPDVVNIINALVPEAQKNTEVAVRYYEGANEIQNIYRNVLTSNAKQVYSFINTDSYFDIFPETHKIFKEYLDKNKDAVIYEIAVGKKSESLDLDQAIKDLGDRCKTKFVQRNENTQNFDFVVYGTTVVMIQISEETPLGIVIESETIANGLVVMHKLLWSNV